jgi:hypothetical protein
MKRMVGFLGVSFFQLWRVGYNLILEAFRKTVELGCWRVRILSWTSKDDASLMNEVCERRYSSFLVGFEDNCFGV